MWYTYVCCICLDLFEIVIYHEHLFPPFPEILFFFLYIWEKLLLVGPGKKKKKKKPCSAGSTIFSHLLIFLNKENCKISCSLDKNLNVKLRAKQAQKHSRFLSFFRLILASKCRKNVLKNWTDRPFCGISSAVEQGFFLPYRELFSYGMLAHFHPLQIVLQTKRARKALQIQDTHWCTACQKYSRIDFKWKFLDLGATLKFQD